MLVALLLIVLDRSATSETIELHVRYPLVDGHSADPNYTVVTLSCLRNQFRDPLSSEQLPATFLRNGTVITQTSALVTVTNLETDSVSIVFTQEQEGEFSCRTALREQSNTVGLAASPLVDYKSIEINRYFIIPHPDTPVHIACAIQPGALEERYRVEWRKLSPPTLVTEQTYNITVVVAPSQPAQYRCTVEIEHVEGLIVEYDGPSIRIETMVLPHFVDEVKNVTATLGQAAHITCQFEKQDNNVTTIWRVGNEEFSCDDPQTIFDVKCHLNDTHSVLQIENTSVLGLGIHLVQCVLRQSIPQVFVDDPSFRSEFAKNTTMNAKLTVEDVATTDCGDPPELVNGRIMSRNVTLVVYECDDQYHFPGENAMSRSCLPDGSWSNEQFYCSANSSLMSPSKFSGNGAYRTVIITTAVTATALVSFVVVLIVGVYCLQRRRKIKVKKHKNIEIIPMEDNGRLEDSISDNHTLTTSTGDASTSQLQQQPLTLTEHLQQELSCKHMLFKKHHLELSKVVGQGESGLVYRGYINCGAGSELVAVKTGKALLSSIHKERLLKEVCVMLSFSHKNVMSLIGLCFDGEVPLLIMPFMINGTVLDYIKHNRETLYFGQPADIKQVESARNTSLGICHQISNGMSYLAKYKFVHRDLAARNCMIDGDGVIKVSDFGLTEDMYGTNYYRRGGGRGGGGEDGAGNEEKVPIRWMAPESIEADFYNEKTDVWSFGVTCWEVMTCGGVPYAGIHVMSLLRELNFGHRLDRPSNAVCSDEIWDMISSCWSTSPSDRPAFTVLVKDLSQMLDNDTSYLKLNDSFLKSQLNTLV